MTGQRLILMIRGVSERKNENRYIAQTGIAYWNMKIHKFKTILEIEVTKVMIFSALNLGYLNRTYDFHSNFRDHS